MEGKFFIIALYPIMDVPIECFRPTEELFPKVSDCYEWIEMHKKYFAPNVRFGVCSVDNSFTI